jgi:5-methylcytosine-specific restriction endonuclease McrA
MIYTKTCLWCYNQMTRTKPSEARRPNWLFCTIACRVSFRNCIQPQRRRMPLSVREKIALANRGKPRPKSRLITGPRHWNWQGGKTSEAIRLRNSARMHEWRTAVFIRDNYTCQNCGARNGNGFKVILNADHIKPFAYYPDLRFDVSNGRTLCKNCHLKGFMKEVDSWFDSLIW